MPAAEEYLARLRDTLRLSDPEWDVAVGTPEYKILEAVSVELARASDDSALLSVNFDIETKAGIDLDNFVRIWGFERLAAKRATGTVTFSRGTPANRDYSISFGTQVFAPSTTTTAAVYFNTVAAGVIPTGQTNVEIPVEAVVGGASGNIGAGKVVNIAGTIEGVTAVVNQNGFAGGRDAENDIELRNRWRKTVLRNISGTEDQFLALAYNEPQVTRAIILGAIERYREQLQFTGGATTVTSTVPDSKYNPPAGGEFMGYRIGTGDEDLGVRTVHYNYVQATSAPFRPSITLTTTGSPNGRQKFPDGSVIDLETEYTPKASRNDPATGITDKIDVFVTGEISQTVTEDTTMSADVFDTTAGSAMNRANWLRDDGVAPPTTGNKYMRLFRQPIMSIPSSITIAGVTYVKNTHYWLIRDVTNLKNSPRSADGIEWAATGTPAAGTAITISYYFNSLIERINEQINLVRLVGTDTLVHRARYLYLRFNLVIMLRHGAQIETAKGEIATTLTDWLNSKGFKDNIQIADVYDVVSGTNWVDNVRLVASSEARSEVQTAIFNTSAGQYRLTFDNKTTGDIAHNADGATIQTALNAAGLSYITAAGTATTAPFTRTFTFGGIWANRNAPMIVVTNGATAYSGTISMAETTQGIGHGIQSIADDGFNILNTYLGDVYLDSDALGVFNDVEILVRGKNTF